jgi:nucleoid DNA-binding protein
MSKTIGMNELRDIVIQKTRYPRKEITEILDVFVATIPKEAKKNPVKIIGFGTFHFAAQKEKQFHNFQTGENGTTPARRIFKFRKSHSIPDLPPTPSKN